MAQITINELARQVETGERPQRVGQLYYATAVLQAHPNAVLIECADERTGQRFGQAHKRAGQCEKLGGARQPRWYQLWASWAPADIREIVA